MVLRLPLRVILSAPDRGLVMPLMLFLLANQPLGSPAALVLYLVAAASVCLLCRVPALPVGNVAAILAFVAIAGAANLVFVPVNPLLATFYAAYLLILVAAGVVVSRRIGSLDQDGFRSLVAWMIAIDLALNLPCVAMQLLRFGPGDMVQGLSGILTGSALSQNRTNSIRAGFMIILCLANLGHPRKALVRLSLAFNVLVLFLATSMTCILSAVVALGIFLFLRINLLRFAPLAVVLGGAAVISDRINQAVFKSTSVFDFLLSLDTRWVPKLDIYAHFFGTMVSENPLLPWIGQGIGGFASRFAVLANFGNYSQFPFKELVSSIFHSPATSEHLIGRYNLESGIVGSSIVSVPWSGAIALLAEFGLAGTLLLALAGRPWLMALWRGQGRGTYARLLALFFLFNLFFDHYLDYPEVAFPFIVAAACLIRGDRSEDAAPAS